LPNQNLRRIGDGKVRSCLSAKAEEQRTEPAPLLVVPPGRPQPRNKGSHGRGTG